MKSLSEMFPSSSVKELLSSNQPGWTCFNPSIANIPGEGYMCIIRSSNFQVRNGEYFFNDPDDICRTKNYLARLDDDLRIVDLEPIDSSWVDSDLFPVRGMEDARLFWADGPGQLKMCGTVRDSLPSGLCRIAVDTLQGTKVISRSFLPEFPEGANAKNYMPRLYGCGFVERCNPPGYVFEGSPIHTAVPYRVDDIALNFRGGSQLIPLGFWEMALIHEVEFTTTGRIYSHRFVLFNSNEVPGYWTPPFYFVEPGIEFAAGLTVHGSDLVASFGLNDERCMLARVSIDDVMDALED